MTNDMAFQEVARLDFKFADDTHHREEEKRGYTYSLMIR